MARFTLQGHNRHGWDTVDVHSMEDVREYLRSRHRGTISLIIDGTWHTVPAGIGNRETLTKTEIDSKWRVVE
jgi:hypothetical protein